MQAAFYAGASGLLANQQYLDTIGNNIANSNTTGYKPTRSSFSNLLFEQMYVNAQSGPISGVGVKIISTDLLMQQGTPAGTDRALDFAILGDGFFAVERNGAVSYTRNGALGVGMMGDTAYLVSTEGAFVLDADGNRIEIPYDEESQKYDIQGVPGSIGVFSFANSEGLESASNTCFRPTEASGAAVSQNANEQKPYRLLQYSLESSQTSMADEMSNMIAAQRVFQLSGKVVQTADQIEEIVNNLRK